MGLGLLWKLVEMLKAKELPLWFDIDILGKNSQTLSTELMLALALLSGDSTVLAFRSLQSFLDADAGLAWLVGQVILHGFSGFVSAAL